MRDDVDGRALRRCTPATTVRHFETEMLRKDGMPMPISLSTVPGRRAGRRTSSGVGRSIARDITEQRLAQAALAEVEARVRESEALAHVGSWLWDLRTGAVQWSDEFHRIHGRRPPRRSTARSTPTWPRSTPTTGTGCAGPSRGRSRPARPFEDEYRVVRPDGEVR